MRRYGVAFWVAAMGCAVSAVTGCATSARIRTDDSPGVHPVATTGEAVRIFFTRDIGTPYDVIGVVIAGADAGNDTTVPLDLLRAEAAALGADAIVETQVAFMVGAWKFGIGASGVAVRLKRGTP
jgi:hypothetical protein